MKRLARCTVNAALKKGERLAGPSVVPKTYQQVKATLRWYMVFAGACFAFFIYAFLVPRAHREEVQAFLHSYVWGPLPIEAINAAAVLVLGFLCWVSVFFLEVHDKVYDRYVIKWRRGYDLDFILPALTRPLASKMDPRFFRMAAQNLYQFMKPYYEFVGDGKRECPVTPNLVVRFYERVTKYWIAQINEVLIVVTYVLVVGYFFAYQRLGLSLTVIVVWALVLPVIFALNRLIARVCRRAVRRATEDEIEDIHRRYPDQLQEAFRELHSEFGLQWRT